MSLSGSIEDLPLLEILQVVSFCQKTGHLTVRTPAGDAAVVFRAGRVVSGYIWDMPPLEGAEPPVRARIATILERLVRLREGEFAFNLTEEVPTRLGGRDLSAEMLPEGINPEELMLELARKLDEDRRDCAATLEASFSAPPEADVGAAAEPPEPAEAEDVVLEQLPPEDPSADELLLLEPQFAPATEAARLPAAADPPAARAVLLVDDEPDVCRVVGQRLSDAGFDVVVAHTPRQARRRMLQLAAEGRRFLLVADLGLPSESGSSFRGGLDIARHAAALVPPPPVLVMTEMMDEKLRGRARRFGVSLLAFKPGLSKLDPLQYEADLRAFADKLAKDLLPRLEGRRPTPGPAVQPPLQPGAAAALQIGALRDALAEIEAHPDPDLVAFLLLRAARSYFPRVVLFVAKDDRLRGLSGFGPVLGCDSLDLLARTLAVTLEEPSPFGDAVVTGKPWQGRIPPKGPLRDLLDQIGPLGASTAAIVPVRASRETIAVVYADAPHGATLPELEPFVTFVNRAGQVLEDSLASRRAAQAIAC